MQENNPVSTPEFVPPVAVEQPKQSKFLTILLSILLIISVAISAFFAYQTQELVKELNRLKTIEKTVVEDMSEPVATESSEVDQTASWKTYTNSKYGFSFKYPVNLLPIFKKPDQNTDVIFFATASEEKAVIEKCIEQIECYTYPFRILINNSQKEKNLSLANYLVKIGYSQGKDTSNFTVDGKESIKIDFKGIGSGSNIFVLVDDQNVMQINTNAILDEEKNLKILDQILSTFKFLD